MNILVINAGSSSLKYQLFEMNESKVLAKGLVERIGLENTKISQKSEGKPDFALVKDMKDHGLEINTFTVNQEEEVRRFYLLGIDGIITNYPDMTKRVLAECAGKE